MTQALGVYNSTSITSEFPSPNIRAGLASLVGTFAEGAIDSYTTSDNASGKPFTVVDFSSEVSNAATIAETTGNVVTKRIRTLFKNSYKGENFLALAPILRMKRSARTWLVQIRTSRTASTNRKSLSLLKPCSGARNCSSLQRRRRLIPRCQRI